MCSPLPVAFQLAVPRPDRHSVQVASGTGPKRGHQVAVQQVPVGRPGVTQVDRSGLSEQPTPRSWCGPAEGRSTSLGSGQFSTRARCRVASALVAKVSRGRVLAAVAGPVASLPAARRQPPHAPEPAPASSCTSRPPASTRPVVTKSIRIVLGDTDVATELDEGDAALRDQPTHEALRGSQALGSLLDGQQRVQLGWPPLPAEDHAAADRVVVVSSSRAIRRRSRARAAADRASQRSPSVA